MLLPIADACDGLLLLPVAAVLFVRELLMAASLADATSLLFRSTASTFLAFVDVPTPRLALPSGSLDAVYTLPL